MSDDEPKHLHVFVNRTKVELDRNRMTGAELLAAAEFEGQEWDLLRLDGEGDARGGEPIDQGTVLELRNGQHFRVIPGNRTFG